MSSQIILLCGIPGSGKSTMAKKLAAKGFSVISSDEIRKEYFGGEFSYLTNDAVFSIMHRQAADALISGKDIVLDATHLSPTSRYIRIDSIKDLLFEQGFNFDAKVICMEIRMPYSLCRFFNNRRKEHCSERSLWDMYSYYTKPDEQEGFDEIQSIYTPINRDAVLEYSQEEKALFKTTISNMLKCALIGEPYCVHYDEDILKDLQKTYAFLLKSA